MASFKVTGGRRLKGEITPQGAKNEALQILCAVVLTAEPVTIHNIPNIRDVNQLIDLLVIHFILSTLDLLCFLLINNIC